jgi:hypothetical protein
MEYKYTNRKVVKLTNNIIKAVEQIVELDDAHYENAHIGIDMEDYSAKYIDGDDILFDDLKGGIEYCDLDLYHPYSMDWIRYNSKQDKYHIMRQNINKFAYEYHKEKLAILRDIKRDMKLLDQQ